MKSFNVRHGNNEKNTVCPLSLAPFYMYYKKTFWTNSKKQTIRGKIVFLSLKIVIPHTYGLRSMTHNLSIM